MAPAPPPTHYASLCPKKQEAPYQQADSFQIQVIVLGENSLFCIVYYILKAIVIKRGVHTLYKATHSKIPYSRTSVTSS